VAISYQVGSAGAGDPGQNLTFRVYRSSDDRLDAGDRLVATATVPAGGPGQATRTLSVPGALGLDPGQPFVVVAADGNRTTSFRTASLAVIVHGGIENPSWKNGPPWELVMARSLRAQGYDAVVPFNWVSESSKPGAAAAQGRRLARVIIDAANWLPAGRPVDMHVIAHSEGAVVATQALQRLGPAPTAALAAGHIKLTLLDPHAATNAVPGRQYSVGNGLLGWVARMTIDDYQSKAHDPPVVVPPWVTDAEVFYQQTTASRDHGTNQHIYNIWGQVPVRGASTYFDLTAASVTHSGKTGVVAWYQRHVVPTLGAGAPGVAASVLTGSLDPADAASGSAGTAARGRAAVTTTVHTPRFEGQAYPGSAVRLLTAPSVRPVDLSVAGRATAGADGSWSLATRPLRDGRYRLLARSLPPRTPDPARLPMVPTAPLGALTVRAPR
jgi:hypothetical protein